MSDPAYAATVRTTASRNRQRVGFDRAAVHAVLDETAVCHVGYVVDGRPVVLPQLHVRVEEILYLHASSGARVARGAAQEPVPVCVTVTRVDGLVLARSAFNHSINYRCVVVHGFADPVLDEDEKTRALAALVDAVVPDRSLGSRGPSRRELAATTVLRLPLEEVSIKARSGPPIDEDADLALPHWAGVLPVITGLGSPEPAPDLATGIDLPDHVRAATAP